jgi:hypothetical protein
VGSPLTEHLQLRGQIPAVQADARGRDGAWRAGVACAAAGTGVGGGERRAADEAGRVEPLLKKHGRE